MEVSKSDTLLLHGVSVAAERCVPGASILVAAKPSPGVTQCAALTSSGGLQIEHEVAGAYVQVHVHQSYHHMCFMDELEPISFDFHIFYMEESFWQMESHHLHKICQRMVAPFCYLLSH